VAILTVPLSRCFSFGWKKAGKVLSAGFPESRPHTEVPPSESGERGPRGSPVWKEKDFWMEWMGEKL
jgi:hypothetical protein